MKTIATSLFFIIVGSVFAYTSYNYNIGTLDNMGPGYYPLMFSLILIAIGIINLLREWGVKHD